jgi:hypothetical protein
MAHKTPGQQASLVRTLAVGHCFAIVLAIRRQPAQRGLQGQRSLRIDRAAPQIDVLCHRGRAVSQLVRNQTSRQSSLVQEPAPLDQLRREVEDVWDAYQQSRFGTLVTLAV